MKIANCLAVATVILFDALIELYEGSHLVIEMGFSIYVRSVKPFKVLAALYVLCALDIFLLVKRHFSLRLWKVEADAGFLYF